MFLCLYIRNNWRQKVLKLVQYSYRSSLDCTSKRNWLKYQNLSFNDVSGCCTLRWWFKGVYVTKLLYVHSWVKRMTKRDGDCVTCFNHLLMVPRSQERSGILHQRLLSYLCLFTERQILSVCGCDGGCLFVFESALPLWLSSYSCR